MQRTASAIRLALWFPLDVVVSGLPITAGLGHGILRGTQQESVPAGSATVPPLRCHAAPLCATAGQRLTFSCFRMSHVSDACGC